MPASRGLIRKLSSATHAKRQHLVSCQTKVSHCKLSIISAGACYKPRPRPLLRTERNRKMAVLLRERRTGIEVILQYPWSDAQWFSGAGWEEDEAAVVCMIYIYVQPTYKHKHLPPILAALTLHTTATRLHFAYHNNGVGAGGNERKRGVHRR